MPIKPENEGDLLLWHLSHDEERASVDAQRILEQRILERRTPEQHADEIERTVSAAFERLQLDRYNEESECDERRWLPFIIAAAFLISILAGMLLKQVWR